MRILREASLKDFPVIYSMQNLPFREMVLVDPLPGCNEFSAICAKRLEQQTGYYFILENNGAPEGFIEYVKSQDVWLPTIWGKWFNTLAYACGKVAFDFVAVDTLRWYAKLSNRRALRYYEGLRFRSVGEREVVNITGGFSHISVGRVRFYEMTEQEFREREEQMKLVSLSIQILGNRVVN